MNQETIHIHFYNHVNIHIHNHIIFILKIQIITKINSKFKNKTNLYSRRVVGNVVVSNRRSVAQIPVGEEDRRTIIVGEEEQDERKLESN